MAKTNSILIKNGHLVDPAARIDADMDILLRDGKVAEVAPKGKTRGKADEAINARGLIVSPGFIDIHAHLREPGHSHKETIASGTAAAAAGGFTSLCAMPNTSPVNDSPEISTWMQSPERGAVVNVFPIAAATQGSAGQKLTDFRALQRAGCVGVTDDGKPILDDAIMRETLRAAGALGLPVIQHAEDTRLTNGCSMNAGLTAFRLGLRGMSVEAESGIVERDIKLAAETRAHLHVAHLSTAAALKAVRRAKREKLRVTCEITPHHFALTDEAIGRVAEEATGKNALKGLGAAPTLYDTRLKMNPPLRSAPDVEAMIAGLLDGAIDCIATDHAPHAAHEKSAEFDRAPFGITGLETALGLTIAILHKQYKAPMARIIELLSANPARVMGLKGRGTLAVGSFADVTLFDPQKRWTYDAAKSRSKSKNSPFGGWPMLGKVMLTIVGGSLVYDAR
jgi:dihydroorotase